MTKTIVTAAEVAANKANAQEALARYREQQANTEPVAAQPIVRTRRQRRIFAASNARILEGK